MLPWVISGTSAPYSKNTKIMPISTCRSYSYSTKGTFRCFFHNQGCYSFYWGCYSFARCYGQTWATERI